MTDERMRHLLDEAVPGIPDDLRRPPLTELRARVRRRRRTRRAATATAGVLVVLLTGPALWSASTSDDSRRTGPQTAGAPTVTATRSPDSRLVWWMARVDRDDRTVTVYVSRLPDGPPCQGIWQPQATVSADADTVTVDAFDGSATGLGCADDQHLTPVQVTLPEPLARRDLVNAYDNADRPVYREADLPEVPGGADGWSEVRTVFSVPGPNEGGPSGAWVLSYTRPGGPDIRIRGYPVGHPLAAVGRPIDSVQVAGVPGRIHLVGEDTFRLRWQVSEAVYLLDVVPAEGDRLSLSTFRDVLARIGVS